MPPHEPVRRRLVDRVLGTFHEMPGLRLTLGEAERLFGVTRTTCEVVLDDLARAGALREGGGVYTMS